MAGQISPTSHKLAEHGRLRAEPAAAARTLVRRGLKAALATLDSTSGHPYASLVTVATEPDGRPVLLLSALALHSKNLAADARASLLFDGSDADGDPLAGGRVTVIGTLRPTASATARRRFLARHPSAAMYADFSDFAFYALAVERAHYVGGFGRIIDLATADLMTEVADAEDLLAAEAEIVAHMNQDHADAITRYAQMAGGLPDGAWRMTGIDPAGLDLVGDGQSLRLGFDRPIRNPSESRAELVRLAVAARPPCAEGGNP